MSGSKPASETSSITGEGLSIKTGDAYDGDGTVGDDISVLSLDEGELLLLCSISHSKDELKFKIWVGLFWGKRLMDDTSVTPKLQNWLGVRKELWKAWLNYQRQTIHVFVFAFLLFCFFVFFNFG